jgi:hypothetical protein
MVPANMVHLSTSFLKECAACVQEYLECVLMMKMDHLMQK